MAGNQDVATVEVRTLVAMTRRLEAAKLLRPGIAARYAGPRASGARTLAIDLDAAWGPVGPDDRLTLTNRSGLDMHNCTVLVELRAGGDAARNVFFVPSWPAGATIHARCPPGGDVLGETIVRRTVPRVASAVASIWSDELTRESIAYRYEGAEPDADIGRYCRDMEVVASYRPFAKGLLWDTRRGVFVRLKGLRFAEHPRITVTFFRGSSELSRAWDFDRWDEGELKTLDAGEGLPWDTESVRVEVGFPDTAHEHRSTWAVK